MHNNSRSPRSTPTRGQSRPRDEALRVVRELEARIPPIPWPPSTSRRLTALGDPDRAFAWLERAYEKRSYLLRVITVEEGLSRCDRIRDSDW